MFLLAARARSLNEAQKLLALGFDILEITLPCPGGLEEERAWAELARQNHLTFLGHGPNEGDPNDLVNLEKKYLPQLKLALEAAQRLECPGLTIHFWFESLWVKQDVALEKISLLARVVEWGTALGVAVNLENLSEPWIDLKPPLDAIPDLGLTLDVGHAQLLHPENTAPDIIERFFHRLRHLHLHDNNGGPGPQDDLHLIPGQGRVPFSRIFGLLKQRDYNRTATLELWPHEMIQGRDFVLEAWRRA